MKIAIIGGGSAYCAGLMESFVRAAPILRGGTICLMDTNAETLEIIANLSRRMVEAAGADLRIRSTTARREAIADAEFVLTTFRPGGMEARILDEKIPIRHGVIGQETQGPGGFFMALRSMPIIREIVSEMERHAPRAILLNYTNPVNIIVEGVTHHSGIRAIGLCEGPVLFARQVAQLSGIDPDTIEIESVGLNHASWSTRFTANGCDLIPKVVEAAAAIVEDGSIEPAKRRMFRLIQQFQRLPSEYLQYYYFQRQVLAELQSRARTRGEELIGELPALFAHYREEAQTPAPQLRAYRGRVDLGRFSLLGDFAVEVLGAIIRDTGQSLILNVPNRSATPMFPDDRVVEIPCTVSRAGAVAGPGPALPPEVTPLLHRLAEYQRLAAEAAWSGGRADALEALASNPLVPTRSKAEAIYAEMAAAHRDHLPARLH